LIWTSYYGDHLARTHAPGLSQFWLDQPVISIAARVEHVTATLIPAAALAFLVVQMLFIPCVATVAVIKQETDSWRWTVFSVILLLVISLGAGVLVYQGARLLGLGV
jgi:Fe2+ transport system protein B